MRRILPAIAVALTAACSSPAGPTDNPPTGGPVLSCPAEQFLVSARPTAPFVYSAPGATGGTAPVAVSCLPASGAAFPVGQSKVNCTALDAQQRTAVCTFPVTVSPVVGVSLGRYVAFGDSITEGKTSDPALIPSPPASYPFKLEAMLIGQYVAQRGEIAVLDEGIGGERSYEGLARLPGVLSADAPQVLLLMEGANDLNFPGSVSDVPSVVENLRRMVVMARARGVVVMVGTLLPQRSGGTSKASNPGVVPVVNAQIRQMVAREGVILVDLYQGFGSSPDPWIGADGLHPTEAGQTRVATIFFEAIRANFETPPPRSPL